MTRDEFVAKMMTMPQDATIVFINNIDYVEGVEMSIDDIVYNNKTKQVEIT